jgi:GMP synthase (glutamine-hydrolysing)
MENRALLLQLEPHDRGGLLETILKEKGWDLEVRPLYRGGAFPISLKGYGPILIPGGPLDFHEGQESRYLKEGLRFIRQALKIDHPVLGLGLGALLMARALGAKIRPSAYKEIGWYWINQTPVARTDPLFSRLDPYLLVFQWHGNTLDLPPEAVCLAGNRAFPNQAFRVGSNAYGLQFHLEITEAIIKDWLSNRVREVAQAAPRATTPEDILSDTSIYLKRHHHQARIFFSEYLDRARKQIGRIHQTPLFEQG